MMLVAMASAEDAGATSRLEMRADGRLQLRKIADELPLPRIHEEQRVEIVHDRVAVVDPLDEAQHRKSQALARGARGFTSRRISRAALCPGAPVTPPPGCVPEPHI